MNAFREVEWDFGNQDRTLAWGHGGVAVGIVVLVLLLWEGAVRLFQVPVYLLPSPSVVVRTLLEHGEYYLKSSGVTLGEALAGLALGSGVGIGLAVVMTFYPALARGIMAVAILVKATPLVAIAPLLVLWLGFGPAPKVVLTALLTFFPTLVNVHAGLHAADPAQLSLFHVLHASRWETFRWVRWPSGLPYLFAALKVTAPLALVGAVVAEWMGASSGLGRIMWLAYTNLNLPMLFAAVFCLACMGVGLYLLTLWLESKVVFWPS